MGNVITVFILNGEEEEANESDLNPKLERG
jgi:hypothetical protein